MEKAKIKFLLLFIMAGLILPANQFLAASFADDFNKSLDEAANKTGHAQIQNVDEGSLTDTVGIIINALLSIVGVIFLGLIIYGGYIWFASRGNDSEVRRAQLIIRNAIIGIIILIAAYAITNFIGSSIISNIK
jgi:hypothetical protein